MPKRIQRKRTKGWKMPPGAVYVGRPGLFGNPFFSGHHGTAAECVAKYREAWERTMKHDRPYAPFGEPVYIGHLIGKDLVCWCPLDAPCHADVLLELVNRK